jgi:hypothetical protein
MTWLFFCISVKLGLLPYGKPYTEGFCEHLYIWVIGCSRRKKQQARENCITSSFVICTPHRKLLGDQIKDYDMGVEHSICGRDKKGRQTS